MENYSNILKMVIRLPKDTVYGTNPAPVDRVVYPIIYRVLYILGGAGFLPSTVFP